MKHYLLICFLFISIGIKAQESNLEIIKSNVFADEKYKTSLLFAKEDTNGDVFLVRNYYKSIASPIGYYIEHYNKDLTLLKSDKIEVNRSELRGIYINDSEVILLQFKYLQKEKKYTFVTLTSNKENFGFTEKEIYSIDRDKVKKYDHYGIRKEIEFSYVKEYKSGEIVESENKDFIAINLFLKNEKNISFFVVVFDKNFKKLYEYDLSKINTKNKSKPSLFAYQNMKIDNQGNVYLLGKVYKINSGKEKTKGEPNYNYELFKINHQGQKQLSFNHSDFFIDKLHLVLKNNNPSCIGFYSNKKYDNSINTKNPRKDGIVRINIKGNTGEILMSSYLPFPKNIFNDSFKKRFRGIDKDNIKLKKAIINDNEDIVLFSEEFIISTYNNQQSSYFYGDIISFKINKQGKLIWAKNIIKEQSVGGIKKIPYASHVVLNQNYINYIFLNANEVKPFKDNQVLFKYKKKDNDLFLITVDEKGNSNYKRLNNTSLKNITLEVRFGIILKENSLLFEATNDDKPLLVKITK